MRVYRRRSKPNGYDQSSGREPLPDIVYQMGAEVAAQYVAQSRHPGSNFGPSAGVYNLPGIYPVGPVAAIDDEFYDEEVDEAVGHRSRASSPANLIRSALRLKRSKSRGRDHNRRTRDRFTRVGSPEQFGRPVAGTPVHFQSRPGSPYLIPHADPIPSPIPFMQPVDEPLVNSSSSHTGVVSSTPADVARRLHRAQVSQDLQRIERQQRAQASLIQSNPLAYQTPYASYPQQQFYPMGNPNVRVQSWPIVQQPAMYSFY